MRVKDYHKIERPREKLERDGVKNLRDFELISIILGSGIKGVNVFELSKKVIMKIEEIGIQKITSNDLKDIRGLGHVKSKQILSSIELSKSFNESERIDILTPKDVWNLCSDIRSAKKEYFVAFYMDVQNRLIERQIVSVGTLDTSLVHPREVFEPAIRLSAASVIVAHNHPSGELYPSHEDNVVTKRLEGAGELLGVKLLDHVLITEKEFKSLSN